MTFLLILAYFLLIFPLWTSLSTYSFFWYENAWKTRNLPNGQGLGGAVLVGMLSSFASVIFILATFPLGYLKNRLRPESPLAPGPVIVLTHGLYHNASAWLLFSKHLRKAGFQNIFVINYRSFFTDFEKTFEKFATFASEASRAAPDRPVYLIGHSLGGLLSRVYAERSLGGRAPAAVITLGSPHQGSKLAAFGPGKLAASLLYRGPLFTKIESESASIPCPGFALTSPVDNMVFPREAEQVPYEGWEYHQTHPLSHTAMLYSKSVARKVIELIQSREAGR
ncbi:MAG: esterase/lipase family protein [Syntrophobacteraceae bacterium]